MNAQNEFKASIGIKWIKSGSGRTYLCSADAADRLGDASDADLERYCVDESENPQND